MAPTMVQLAVLSALLLHIEAHQLSPNNDAGNCAGGCLDSWVGQPDQHCLTEYVSTSNMVIRGTGPADDDTRLGIRPEDWDDKFHSGNPSPPPSAADSPVTYNLSFHACQFTATCTRPLVGGATFSAQSLAGTVKTLWTQVGNLAVAQKVKITRFVRNHPVIQSLIPNLLPAMPPELGSNWLSGLLSFMRSIDIADCSAIHAQLDAILTAISARPITLTETTLVTVTAVNTAIETVTRTRILTVECG